MKRAGLISGVLLALAFACFPDAGLAAPLGADGRAAVEGNTAFALGLYAKLAKEPGNLFFSPYSISTALAMTYAGAKANTEAQMARVLHFGLEQKKLHPLFEKLAAQVDAGGEKRGYQLSVANALWGHQGYKLLDEFLKITREHYGGGLRQVDFKTATEAARQRINAWVAQQTQGKIKDLIPVGILNELTRLVLTNAIYFKGDWASQFKKEQTRKAPFTLADGTPIKVPTMSQTGKFGYIGSLTFKAIEMPYAGGDLSMVLFVPRRCGGLPALESTMNAGNLTNWLRRLSRPRKVVVSVPRFKITSAFRLDQTLKAMGMVEAFTKKADFSGMTGDYDLFLAAVLHKAFVDVSEEGTEAAAATAVVMEPKSKPSLPPIFRADRPFLFLIRHKPTNSILFMGRVVNPTKEN